MPALSLSKRRPSAGLAEVYAGVLIVSVTLALSAYVYSQAHYSVTSQPVYVDRSFDVYGSPSILHLQVNSSAPTTVGEERVDAASSSQGILRLTSSGYAAGNSLCASGESTFFSVNSTSGPLKVSTDGSSWIDGVESRLLVVGAGWHEVIIDDGKSCSLTLPDGSQPVYPSPSISGVARFSSLRQSFLFLVPYLHSGHVVTLVFSGSVEQYAF